MASIGFDRRRVNGPEESHAPVFEEEEEEDESIETISEDRRGRAAGDIRPICASNIIHFTTLRRPNTKKYKVLKTGLISQASGSAYIETEKTKIACAMYV